MFSGIVDDFFSMETAVFDSMIATLVIVGEDSILKLFLYDTVTE